MFEVYEEEPQEFGEIIVIEPGGNAPSWRVFVEYEKRNYELPVQVTLVDDNVPHNFIGEFNGHPEALGVAMMVAFQWYKNKEVVVEGMN